MPPELLLKIFRRVSHDKTLFALLTVSRSVNELAEAVLYEDVCLLAPQMKQRASDGRQGLDTYWASSPQMDIDGFSASLSANGGRLGARMKRLHIRWPYFEDADFEWRKFFSFCPNLKYLKMSPPSPGMLCDTSVLCSLHGSVRLTHLSLDAISSHTSVQSFLESQHALESLSISRMHDRLSLSPDALPNLIHLSGPWVLLASLIPGRRVAHLEISDVSTPATDEDLLSLSITQALDSIQSLVVLIDEHFLWLRVLPKLHNLKYLKIVHLSFDANAVQSQLSQLSSTKLRYLQLGLCIFPSQDLNWTRLFKTLPSLRLLDVRHAIHRPESTWHRYRLNGLDIQSPVVDVDYDSWQRWWQVIEPDVEYAVSRGGSYA